MEIKIKYVIALKPENAHGSTLSRGGYMSWLPQHLSNKYNKNRYAAKTQAAFHPPVTGYYSFVKTVDDRGFIFIDLNGTMIQDNQEQIGPDYQWGSDNIFGPQGQDAIQGKFFLEADKAYPYTDILWEWNGGDRSQESIFLLDIFLTSIYLSDS